MSTKFLLFLTLFSILFICISTLTATGTLPDNAITVLSDSGYNSMALILEFGSRSILIPPSPSLTIFSPSDTVFSKSGQPSLNLLQFHFSPLSLSLHSLKSLPSGSKISTFWTNHSLIVTSDGEDKVEVNGVKISGFPVYDDGSLVIFGIDKILDPNFQVLDSMRPPPLHNLDCPALDANGDGHIDRGHSFKEASEVLRSREYSVMASFLDLQLTEFKDQMRLTIFAPTDESVQGSLGHISEYKSIFLRHFVPCTLSMINLIGIESAGIQLHAYLDGFLVNFTTHGDNVRVNGVQVIAPKIYNNSWLVVHGLDGSLIVEEMHQEAPHSSSDKISNCADAVRGCVFFVAFWLLFLLFIVYENTFTGVIFLILLGLLSSLQLL
ncbi:putative fasciclin-like arabinogalactan protein 20 [Ricinus communis]|uniref:putative fasciclin-like arabinogalactan protein 20 n=1 Tax=Ricinus communis TaxID=3988 RepID=UPI00201ABB38|nr:putative fasciclin-like arabinogalactan protein 20 [Ricinus communis]